METISVARELIKSNHYLASVNLSHAYFSIPIHESYRRFLHFIWKEQLYEYVCLPFGYSLDPRTFTKILKPLYSLLRSNGMNVCYYIIARNSEPLPLAKRDETLPCALFLFIGKCMEMIV